jgi:Fic family protein
MLQLAVAAGFHSDRGAGTMAMKRRPRLPEPLPPALAMEAQLVVLLTEAEAALAELSAAVERAPDTRMLVPACLALEAMYSCRLAGVDVRLSDLYLAQIGGVGARDPRAVQAMALWRSASAMQRGRARLRDSSFDLVLVDHLRRWLETGSDEGVEDRIERGALPVPEPLLPPSLRIALEAWEHFAADERVWMPPLVRSALLHAQFEALRPFETAHGPLSRLLVPLYLISRRQLSTPLWFLSAYWHAHRGRYRARLRTALADGTWEPWLEFFMLGVRAAARSALIHAGDLLRLRESLHREARGIANAPALIDSLLVNPYTTLARTSLAIGRTQPTASALIQALVRKGWLREVTGRARGRIYLMPRILSAIERLPPMA